MDSVLCMLMLASILCMLLASMSMRYHNTTQAGLPLSNAQTKKPQIKILDHFIKVSQIILPSAPKNTKHHVRQLLTACAIHSDASRQPGAAADLLRPGGRHRVVSGWCCSPAGSNQASPNDSAALSPRSELVVVDASQSHAWSTTFSLAAVNAALVSGPAPAPAAARTPRHDTCSVMDSHRIILAAAAASAGG